MKIVRIKLRNLASIEGDAEINFEQEPLASAGIFAISGPTGSGKSTILDALCLALYDKIPRFDGHTENTKINDGSDSEISQNDVRNILRRGTSDGYAEVDFIGINEIPYRSKWSVRRSYGKVTGKLQSQVISVFNLMSGDVLQGTKTELLSKLEEAIGLTYEQFTRTVLLAQNDFATFLKSKEDDKAELLEKLTGTEIYSEISRQIYNRNKEEQAKIKKIETQLEVIKVLPEDEIEEIRKTYDDLQKSLKSYKNDLDLAKEIDVDFKAKKATEDKIRDLRILLESIVAKITEKSQEIKNQEEAVILFNKKVKEIHPVIEKALELDIKLSTKKEQLFSVDKKFKEITKELTKKQEDYKSINKEYDNALKKLKQTYDSLQIPDTVERNMTAVGEYLKIELDACTEKEKELTVDINKLNIEEVNKKQQELSVYKEQHNKLTIDYSKFIELNKEIEKLSLKEIDTKNKQKKFEKSNGVLLKEIKSTQIKYEQTSALYRESQIKVSANVESLRAQLEQGKACPVCGNTDHIYRTATIKSEFSVLEEAYNKLQKELRDLQTKQVGIEKELVHLSDEIVNINNDKNEKNKVCVSLKSSYNLEVFSEEFISQRSDKLHKEELRYAEVVLTYNRLVKERETIVRKKDEIHSRQERLNEGFNIYNDASHSKKIASKEYQTVQERYKESKGEYDKESEILQQLTEQRKALLKGKSVSFVKESIETETKNLTTLKETLAKEYTALTTEKAKMDGQLIELNSNKKNYDERLTGHTEKSNTENLNKLLEMISKSEKECNTHFHTLEKDKENKKRYLDFKKELEKQTEIAEEWSKLNFLLGSATGSRFKKIAQGYTLKILLLHANKHLGYLARRYRLEQIENSLALQVIDCDMCDEVRTVLSLSGGESFLISLSLALGLSSLSSNNLKVESLFIDEGFGSLDSESLRTAMDALEQLQMQGRKIGVISHVQEMSERIAVQIRLQKEASGKSKVVIH